MTDHRKRFPRCETGSAHSTLSIGMRLLPCVSVDAELLDVPDVGKAEVEEHKTDGKNGKGDDAAFQADRASRELIGA